MRHFFDDDPCPSGSGEARSRTQPDFQRDGGLVRAIVQDHATKEVLMDAYMNEEAFNETVATGKVVFYSRSRGKLWRKGEESGHFLLVREIRINCNRDSLLLLAEQTGPGTCHEGYCSCFYRRLLADGETEEVAPRCFDPNTVYMKN